MNEKMDPLVLILPGILAQESDTYTDQQLSDKIKAQGITNPQEIDAIIKSYRHQNRRTAAILDPDRFNNHDEV